MEESTLATLRAIFQKARELLIGTCSWCGWKGVRAGDRYCGSCGLALDVQRPLIVREEVEALERSLEDVRGLPGAAACIGKVIPPGRIERPLTAALGSRGHTRAPDVVASEVICGDCRRPRIIKTIQGVPYIVAWCNCEPEGNLVRRSDS